MDEGRRWAIETFGAHGVHIRSRVAELVREEHTASADAQEASGHRSRGVYGEFWRGILERFEEFGLLPHASLLSPGRAPYKIPVINGVAVFPWRFGRSGDEDLRTTHFVTSDAREALFVLDGRKSQGELNLGIAGRGLTDEEQELADTIEDAISNGVVTANKVVVVPISSSPMGLHSMGWGEAIVTNEGLVAFGFFEDLTSVEPTPLTLVEGGGTFTEGEPPKKEIRLQSEPDDEDGVPASEDE